ncbi:MT-A70-domain-containing protein [Tilletiaria anomala UBC 951]|uniref:mRNA m(6)A methyltransferase n=1 Tax=Tilletiaria anomala (strain ATCC 24038 / CBS 436.72 / UBC 951) TaxID=1037660 RepID=A0A066W202_TILAU|nr:MT-A70-domain-containing protein [Tilletiaria anomala UBC 951]KDN47746.1 MT-A70-domain-containing protein [Tilletiaria anomala UBC 951]
MAAQREQSIVEITHTFLERPTAKQKILAKLFHSQDNCFQPFCEHLTRAECDAARQLVATATGIDGTSSVAIRSCRKLHFEPVLYPQTNPSLGHCSYLNTCHRLTSCKYFHFRIAQDGQTPPFEWQAPYPENSEAAVNAPLRNPLLALERAGLADDWAMQGPARAPDGGLLPAQWIDCDLKTFDFSILGNDWNVIIADPPWDIHMSLPYGTMTDDDMRSMPIPLLQKEGLIFLWVTGRAMELGRELLRIWGYRRVDELVWVKIGQTQRLIRTGRTGHWLNHTKEHCLVGAKIHASAQGAGNAPTAPSAQVSNEPGVLISDILPAWVHRGFSADVIVSEVRDTSRKPDELYGMIEKLCPGGKKIELFGRRMNCRPGYLTLGNQLKSDNVFDPVLRDRLQTFRQQKVQPHNYQEQ